MSKTFFKNGNVHKETSYANGVFNGVSKSFNDKGILTSSVSYTNATLNGPSQYYGDDGKIDFETDYTMGQEQKIVTYDYDKNTKRVETRHDKIWTVNTIDLTSGKVLSSQESPYASMGYGSGTGELPSLDNFPIPPFPVNATITDTMNGETSISFLLDDDYKVVHAYLQKVQAMSS